VGVRDSLSSIEGAALIDERVKVIVFFPADAPMCLARAVTTPAELRANVDIERTSMKLETNLFGE
jgi:hypothetical protein